MAILVDRESGECRMEWPVLKIGPTAQQGMRAMPELRALGFKGSGTNFDLQAPQHYAALNIQTAQGNTRAIHRFTINVSVISRNNEEPPNPGANYGVGWRQRLGVLTPQHYDRSWHVYAGLPTAETAAEILAAIRDHALPAMRAKISDT